MKPAKCGFHWQSAIEPSQMKPILIIDFEAETDNRGRMFPVEIGLCQPGKQPKSALIRPLNDWVTDSAKIFNEALLTQARAHGQDADQIARQIRTLAEKYTLVSDAVFIDRPLLNRLMSTISSSYKSEMTEFFPLLQHLANQRGLSQAQVNKWIAEIDEMRDTAHRAGEDARVRADLLAKVIS